MLLAISSPLFRALFIISLCFTFHQYFQTLDKNIIYSTVHRATVIGALESVTYFLSFWCFTNSREKKSFGEQFGKLYCSRILLGNLRKTPALAYSILTYMDFIFRF